MAFIELKNVSFSYEKQIPVLSEVSFEVRENESVGIIGANGAGKSTLLKLLVGLAAGYTGQISVAGIPVIRENLAEIRKKAGYVFQDSDSQLFMTTVGEDVAFAPRNYGMPPEQVRERVDHALALTGITHLKDKAVYKLSGGEKKLASIATILSMTPEVILMDEPSASLDPKNRRNLIRIINGLEPVKIIASHDLDFILDTCSRAILISDGRIVKDGPAEEILTDRKLLEENGLELPLSISRNI